MKWIDHRAIDDCPNDLYIILLNDNINPINIPVIIVNIIIILKFFGNSIVCSGLIIHSKVVPNRIVVGIIIIIGMFE